MAIAFTLNAVPKPEHKRKEPKRAARAAFNQKTRKRIIERDNGLCVRCRKPYDAIHHIIFRSAGGMGTMENGVCVCTACHGWAHAGRKGRQWFEQYQLERLITK